MDQPDFFTSTIKNARMLTTSISIKEFYLNFNGDGIAMFRNVICSCELILPILLYMFPISLLIFILLIPISLFAATCNNNVSDYIITGFQWTGNRRPITILLLLYNSELILKCILDLCMSSPFYGGFIVQLFVLNFCHFI